MALTKRRDLVSWQLQLHRAPMLLINHSKILHVNQDAQGESRQRLEPERLNGRASCMGLGLEPRPLNAKTSSHSVQCKCHLSVLIEGRTQAAEAEVLAALFPDQVLGLVCPGFMSLFNTFHLSNTET